MGLCFLMLRVFWIEMSDYIFSVVFIPWLFVHDLFWIQLKMAECKGRL